MEIIGTKLHDGDKLTFIEQTDSGQRSLHFTVNFVDQVYAYFTELDSEASDYRVSLRSGELRRFDKMGWTLLVGEFHRYERSYSYD